MECHEACSLIDRGLTPGSRTPLSARLGFHLAACPACRAYRTRQEILLANLLAQPAPLPSRRKPATAQRIRRALSGSLIGLVLCALFAVLAIAWRTNANLEAITDAGHKEPAGMPPATTGMMRQPGPQPAADGAPAAANITLPTATHWPTLAPANPTIEAAPTLVPLPTPLPAESVTVLLLGSDMRPGETSIPRTDALMLVRVEPEHKRIALLSLPRDLWVEIPGYGQNRINTAYVWGEYYGGSGGGLNLARRTVSELLHLPIDYVALINFESFIGLIDSIGGITIDVEQALYDHSFPTMDYGVTEVRFPAGRQHMDGATALIYCRIRHPDSDFKRTRRQQQVLVAIANQLRARGALANLLSADRVSGALVGYVQTDMPKETLLSLIWALRGGEPTGIEYYALDETMVSFGVDADRYALRPNDGQLEALTASFLKP